MSQRDSSKQSMNCAHTTLNFNSSARAEEFGFYRRTAQQRATAAGKGRSDPIDNLDNVFPARALLLPGDDLSCDPRWPPQSLRSWVREKERNSVTPERRTIYVAAPPEIEADAAYMESWAKPKSSSRDSIPSPRIKDIMEYLSAFYHGMSVKPFPITLRFSSWDDGSSFKKKAARQRHLS